jgi:hypothetical protein
MTTTKKNTMRALAAVALLTGAAGAAQAGGRVNWSIAIGLPALTAVIGAPLAYAGPPMAYAPPPMAYAPPPMVYAPAPVVYAPAPRVVYAPAQVVYAPVPVVVSSPYGHGWKKKHKFKHDRWHDDD